MDNKVNRSVNRSMLAQAMSIMCSFLALVFLLLFLMAIIGNLAHGQTPNVVVSPEPPVNPQTTKMYYNGSGQVEYLCKANGWKTQTQWSIGAGTLLSLQVTSGVGTLTTSSAHGVVVGSEIVLSGSSTSAINNTYTVTSVGTTTITLNKTLPDGTYTDTALRAVTTQPKTSAAVWTIQKFVYSGGLVVDVKSSKAGQICDNRAATGTTQISYQ